MSPAEIARQCRQAARELDFISADLEEYGAISASSAALIRQPGESFKFDLDLTAREIFERERLEGFSNVSRAEALEMQVSLALRALQQANSTPGNALAAKLRGQAEGLLTQALLGAVAGGLTGSDNPVAIGLQTTLQNMSSNAVADAGSNGNANSNGAATPPAGSNGLMAVPEFGDQPTRKFLPSDKATAFQTSPGADALNIRLRDLIKLVFDDHTTLKLFEWLSAPTGLGENQQLYAAVMNVSIRPGRRTYEGYVGEINIRPEYAWFAPDGEPRRLPAHPLAFAVFPALDSQVLDLRTSIRRQLALTILLQAQAAGAAGKGLLDAVQRLEQDVATISTLNAVVAFNESGRHFGWRFYPQLYAQADPSKVSTRPANLLRAESFPALVLLTTDIEDLNSSITGKKPAAHAELGKSRDDGDGREMSLLLRSSSLSGYAHVDTNGTPIAPGQRKNEQDGLDGRATHLSFWFTSRWLRAPAPHADASWVPLAATVNRWQHPRLTEERTMEWAIHLAKARDSIKRIKDKIKHTPCEKAESIAYMTNHLSKRINALEADGIHADTYWALPVTPEPKPKPEPPVRITAVAPEQGWIGDTIKNCFVVAGAGLNAPDAKFYVGGIEIQNADVDSNAATFCMMSFPGRADVPVDVAIVNSNGAAVLRDAITFSRPEGDVSPRSRVEVGWNGTSIQSIETRGDDSSAEILKRALDPCCPFPPGVLNFQFDAQGRGSMSPPAPSAKGNPDGQTTHN